MTRTGGVLTTLEAELRALAEPVLNAYAIIYFARRPALGLVILGITFLCPLFGLFGLAGVLVALVGARFFGFSAAGVHNGELLYNSLLVSLALAYLTSVQPIAAPLLVVLLLALSLATLFLSVALGQLARQLLGLPILSMPFVIMTVLLYLLFYAFTGTPIVGSIPTGILPEPSFLPVILSSFFQSLAASLFLPLASAGLVLFAALLWHSRLLALLAVCGFAAGTLFIHLTDLSMSAFGAGWLGTNFIFCGIALGGIYFVPGSRALTLAVICTVFCALIAIAMRAFLWRFNIPPLSLPCVVVILTAVYALRRRDNPVGLYESPYFEITPEAIVRRFYAIRRRFPDSHLPALFLPFSGERVVTQGFSGPLTHQDRWCHALDFEVLDDQGQALPPQRDHLEDAYTFGSPVLAPCDGSVVRVINHIADNPLGQENLIDNWGNLVILVNDFGAHVKLCHFRQGGVQVHEGQRVSRGQLLGYCGNSGRSPLPHLHLQIQSGPLPGAPTLPFRLLHYVTLDGVKEPRFHLLGVPEQGTRLMPLVQDAEIAECFAGMLSTRVRYRIETVGQAPSWETIEATSAGWGQVCYRSLKHDAALHASTTDNIHLVQAMEGRIVGVLGYLWLGLSLVPFSRDRRISWTDEFDPRPFRSHLAGWAADVIEPFTGVTFLGLRRHFAKPGADRGVIVTTELPASTRGRLPRRIEAHLTPGAGLVEMQITTAGGVTRVLQERYDKVA